MKVRTRMQPDREIEVTDSEAAVLRKQGLLVETPEPDSGTPETRKAGNK